MNLLFIYTLNDLNHEATTFKPAVDLIDGKILFKDSYCLYTPMIVYIQAFSIKLFGKNLLNLKINDALFIALTSIFLWLIWNKFLSNTLSTISIIIWNILSFHFINMSLPSPSTYALFFQVISAYFFIIYLDNKQYKYIFLAGIFTALVFFSKQNVGVFLLASQFCIFFLFNLNGQKIFEFFKQSIVLLLGFLLILSGFILYFYLNGSLSDWFIQNIVGAKAWGANYGSGYNVIVILLSLLKPFFVEYSIFSLIPIVLVIYFIKIIRELFTKKLSKQMLIVLSIVIISFASWLQYYPMHGPFQFWWSASIMIGLFVFIINDALSFFVKLKNNN